MNCFPCLHTDYLIDTTLTVVEGEALYELSCGVPDSAHSTNVRWTQGTRPLPFSPSIIPFGARLLFTTVQSAHQGEYTCTYNGSTFNVFLNVLGELHHDRLIDTYESLTMMPLNYHW